MLDDKFAIPLYIFFELWNILVSGSAGPVAIAVGRHITATTQADDRASDVAFGVVAICAASLSMLHTTFKLWDPSLSFTSFPTGFAGRQRRMVSDRSRVEHKIQGSAISTSHVRRNWNVEVPDFCGGVFLSTLITIFLVLAVLALNLGVLVAFVAGFVALALKLLTGEGEIIVSTYLRVPVGEKGLSYATVQNWAIVASLPAAIFAGPAIAGRQSLLLCSWVSCSCDRV